MDELVKVVVDDSQSTGALNRIAAAGARADTSINNLGQTIDKTTQATRSASGAAASNATSVQNQASAFQRLQSIVTGAASSFQRLASTTSGTLGSAFSRLQTVAGNAFSAIIAYANNASGALNNFNRNLQQNQRTMDNLWRLASATAAANIFGAIWDKAIQGISAYIDRMTEVQRTMSMLTVVTPTGQQAEFDYIMTTADKYGVRLQSLANNYAKLAISAREANVPQETMRKLFEGTSIGARVMHMSVSQVDLTFQALTQMMSKGIVSTEELRRQFAERMPGAIHATAKELGVTYDELDNFIKKGKALSDKFIPYLANALINSFGKGIGPAASALDAELNRIHNSFDKFFKQVYDAGGDKGPAAAIRALNEKLNNPEIAKSFARWVDSISKEVTKFIQSITMEDIEKGANTFISVLKAIGDTAVFAAKSVKWLSENLSIVGGLLGAYMGAKIGFMVAGPPGMAVGAAIGGLGGAVGGMVVSGAGTPRTQLQPSKTNSQMFLENQLRLQASGSTSGTQFNKADLDLLSGLPQTKIDALPELLPLKKVGPGTTLDDLLGGAPGGPKNGPGAKAAAAAAERALEKQEDLMAKLHGLNKNFAEEWDTLNTVFNSAANKKQQFLPLEELISLQQELLEQQPFMKKIRKDEAASLEYQMKELDEYNKVQQKLLDDKKKMADESMIDAQRMEDEAVAWQYAKDNAVDLATGIQMMAQARAQDNYETALAAGSSGETLLALQKELEARNRILNQTKTNNIRDNAEEEYKKLAKQQANFWDDTFQNADRAGRSIFQSLARGGDDAFKQVGETIKTSIIDVLYQMTAQKWMISIGTSIFGDGFAAAAARVVGGGVGGGGAGGALSTAGGIGNMASLASGIGSFTTAGMLPGAMATALTGSTSSLAMGLSGAWGAGGGMLSTLNAGASMLGSGSIMSGLGTLAGALGPVALGIGALAAIFGKKSTPHTGGIGAYSAASGATTGSSVGLAFGIDQKHYTQAGEDLSTNVAKSIVGILDATATTFGKQAGYYAATAFADDSSKDGAWGALRIKFGEKVLLDWADTAVRDANVPREFADGEAGQKEYLAEVAKGARDALVQAIGEVDWATDMLTALGDTVSLESLAQTVQQINAAKAAFVGFGQYMPTFASLADSAVSKIVQASGGVDALAGNMSVFVAEFFTEEERLKVTTDNVTAALAKLGYEMPRTRDEFKALLQANIALGDAGADTVAGLLGVSGAFASVTAASETAAEAAARLADEQAKAAKEAQDAYQKQAQAAQDAANAARRAQESLLENLTKAAEQALEILGNAIDAEKKEQQAGYDAQMVIIDAQRKASTTFVEAQRAWLGVAIGGAQNYAKVMESEAARIRGFFTGMVLQDDPDAPAGASVFSAQAALRAGDTSDVVLRKATDIDPEMFASWADYAINFFDTKSFVDQHATQAERAASVAASDVALLEQQLTKAEEQYQADLDHYTRLEGIAKDTLEANILRLDGILQAAQDQLAEALGTKLAVMGLGAALGNFEGAVARLSDVTKNPVTTPLSTTAPVLTTYGTADRADAFVAQVTAYNPAISGATSSSTNNQVVDVLREVVAELQALRTTGADTRAAVEKTTALLDQVTGGGNAMLTETA